MILFDRRKKWVKQVGFLTGIIIGMILGGLLNEYKHYLMKPKWEDQQAKLPNPEFLSPVSFEDLNLMVEEVHAKEATPEATPKPTPEPVSEDPAENPYSFIVKGKISYYSWDGCIGCNENRIMANGEQLDDGKYTVALWPELYRKYKNQIVFIRNEDNGKVITAKVTDSGGFKKYNRVADLSKAAYDFLEAKTDVSELVIY